MTRRYERVPAVAIGVAIAAFMLLLGVRSCTRPEPYLAALRADPLATAEIPGLTLVHEHTTSGSDGGFFGKRRQARVTRVFRGTGPRITDAELDHAVRVAASHGWPATRVSANGYTATKSLEVEGRGRLAYLVISRDTIRHPQTVVLSLTAG